VAIAWIVGFAGVFFQLVLPNDASGLSRADVWLVLPDIISLNVFGHAEQGNVGWHNFSQRLPMLAVGAWVLSGAWGVGSLLLRVILYERSSFSSLERFVFAMGLGLSAVSLLVLGCGLGAQRAPVLMSRGVLGTVISLPIVIELLLRLRRSERSFVEHVLNVLGINKRDGHVENVPHEISTSTRVAVVLVTGLFVLAMLLGSLLPSIDFDVKEYHLGGPKEWFQTGSVHFLPHNVYTSFPFLTEMLLLLGMVLSGDWFWGASAGQMVLASFGVLTGLGVFAAARRWFGEPAAWAGLLIHLSTPWTYRISVIAYAEGGLTFYLFAAFFAVVLAIETHQRRWLVISGLLAGSAMACKYPGLLSVVLPLGAVVVVDVMRRGASLRNAVFSIAVYSVAVLVAVGPWLLKNFVETGNPIYPLLYRVFGGIDWNADLEAHWKHAHSPPDHVLLDIFVKLFDVTLKSDWLSPLLFGLAPFAVLMAVRQWKSVDERARWQARLLVGSAGFVAFQFASWWLLTHRIDRFWVPLIPLVSLLAGVGVWWSNQRLWRVVAGAFVGLSVLFNLCFITLPNCGLNAYLSDLQEVAEQTQSTASGIAALNRMKLPEGSKVLLVGEAQIFDARLPVVYNTVFDVSIFEQWCSANVPELPAKQQPFHAIVDIKQRFAEEGITHVFVNWQEMLRYRTTGYGGSDFVEPERFRALCEAGVLRILHPTFTGLRPASSFRTYELDEIKRWAPSLLVETSQGAGFINGQLFAVER